MSSRELSKTLNLDYPKNLPWRNKDRPQHIFYILKKHILQKPGQIVLCIKLSPRPYNYFYEPNFEPLIHALYQHCGPLWGSVYLKLLLRFMYCNI